MNRVLALIFAVALAIPTLNAANEVDAEELQNYIQALEQRLEQLEAQTGVIQERQIQIEEETMTYLESLGALKELSDRVELSGNVDVIYSSTDSDVDGDSTDVFVDQVYLGLAIDISDNVNAYVSLQTENTENDSGEGDALGVYEAFVTLSLSDDLSLTAGKQHFNFINDAEYGNFIADTFVRQAAECRETGLALDFSNDAISGGVFAFNGDVNEDGDDDEIDTYGLHGSIGGDQENMSWSIGLGYISNVLDANNVTTLAGIADNVDAISVNASFSSGPFSILAETVETDDLADGSEPTFTTIEASMALGESAWTLSAKYEETDDLSGSIVEENVGIGVSGEIYENTLLTVNLESAEEYDGDETDTLAVELRVSF